MMGEGELVLKFQGLHLHPDKNKRKNISADFESQIKNNYGKF